jgi:hypothetical protein
MKVLVETDTLLQEYYVTRDLDCLRRAIETINAELQNPTLQEHTITLNHLSTTEVKAALVANSGFLRVGIREADSDGLIVADQFVRVYPNDLANDTECFIFNVAHIDDNYVVLVAVGGMPDVA